MSLLVRAGVRELARHPVQLVLALAGIALGVAVGVAVDVANESAGRAFWLATEATSGRATHAIAAGSTGVDERLYARLRLELGLSESAPVVETRVVLPGRGGRTLRLLGVDPFADAPFRPFVAAGAGSLGDVARLLTAPGAIALSRPTADRLGLAPGDRFAARSGARRVELELALVIDPADDTSAAALSDLALADIATAQEIARRAGRLDRIELVLPEGDAGRELERRIAALLPADARLEPAGARAGALDRMTRAFRFNLRALSGLALLCGAFLIFNVATFSVVRRRDLFARLRATGVDAGALVRALVAEAALLGTAGSLLGLALGVALARGLVDRVLGTISDLYFTVSVRDFEVPASTLAIGFALGLVTTVAAALPPAIEAARAPLRDALAGSALERRAGRLISIAARLGVVTALAGVAAIVFVAGSLTASLAGFLLLVVGASMLVPAALTGVLRAAAVLPGLALRQAARGVERSLARSGPAAAALALAVAVSLAIALSIASFRSAVVEWLDATLVGDLYLAAPAGAGAASPALPPELVARLAALPGVERVTALRFETLPDDERGAGPALLGVDTDPRAFAGFRLRAGEPRRARERVASGRGALISEPLARRLGLAPGDRIAVPTPTGAVDFEVAGIHVDFGSDRGAIAISQERFVELFPGTGLAALSIAAAPGADLAQLGRAAALAAAPLELDVRSQRDLKRYSLAVFDRTFRVTGVLRTLALVVAGFGVAAALAALALERGRHFALLAALGLDRWGVARVVLAECAALGFAAGLAALPIGGGLAGLLVGVVQRRSFGWSFPLELPLRPFLESLALAVGAAVVAGALAALHVARRETAEALRAE
ncbi:MAG: permease [Acidobacteriota bacterium]